MNNVSASRQTVPAQGNAGFTLLETLISLAIFMAIALPLVANVYTIDHAVIGLDKITATCILEQEVALCRAFPDKIQVLKTRRVGDVDWTVRTTIEGKEFATVRLTVDKADKQISKVVFYHYRKM